VSTPRHRRHVAEQRALGIDLRSDHHRPGSARPFGGKQRPRRARGRTQLLPKAVVMEGRDDDFVRLQRVILRADGEQVSICRLRAQDASARISARAGALDPARHSAGREPIMPPSCLVRTTRKIGGDVEGRRARAQCGYRRSNADTCGLVAVGVAQALDRSRNIVLRTSHRSAKRKPSLVILRRRYAVRQFR